ncbi:MAG: NAD(P)-dependent oxidoreductase [Mycobacteriales bacterium]|nr:NAD(P)-dependent oxidoreductase [Mycobacteriales bacterium]
MVRYAVTGATGWLGRAAAALLRERGDDVVCFGSRAREGVLALEDLPDVPHDVLLHYAYVTRDHLADGSWERYVAANVAITDIVLQSVARHQPALFYASTGAAEQPGGMRDNPYAALKRLDEHVLRDASGGRCAVARVYNVGGPYATKPEVFLLTDLVQQGLSGQPLQLRSNRRVIRSYVDVTDLAAWAVAAAGTDVCVGTAGTEEVEAADVAEAVHSCLGLTSPIVRPQLDPTLPDDRYAADPEPWLRSCAALGVEPRDLRAQVERTAAYAREAVATAV